MDRRTLRRFIKIEFSERQVRTGLKRWVSVRRRRAAQSGMPKPDIFRVPRELYYLGRGSYKSPRWPKFYSHELQNKSSYDQTIFPHLIFSFFLLFFLLFLCPKASDFKIDRSGNFAHQGLSTNWSYSAQVCLALSVTALLVVLRLLSIAQLLFKQAHDHVSKDLRPVFWLRTQKS